MAKRTNNVQGVVSADVVNPKPLINADWDHLDAVIVQTGKMQESASVACITEIRRKVLALDLTPEYFTDVLLIDVGKFEKFDKRQKEYNAERMKAYGKHITEPKNAIMVANLIFTDLPDGGGYCECLAFRINDESNEGGPLYTVRFSSLYNQLWSMFMTQVKQGDPAKAFAALNGDNAAAELRKWYQTYLEENQTDNTGSGDSDHDRGDADVPKLEGTEPEWLQACYTACNNLRRHAYGAYGADPEKAAKLIIPLTDQLQDMVRNISATVRGWQSDEDDAKAAEPETEAETKTA